MKSLLIKNCTFAGGKTASVHILDGVIAGVAESQSLSVPEETETLDAGGGTLLRGLIDTHCHPFEYGWLKRNLDLRGTSNITGLRLRLYSRVQRTPPGEWVSGRGWDNEAFADGRMPSRADIDDLTPRNPALLVRICGHIALLNSAAINALGLEKKRGDEFERDSSDSLTGIVKENAVSDAFSAISRSPQKSSLDLEAAEVEAARMGLTTLHCILSKEGYVEELGALTSLHESGSLTLRFRVYVPPEAIEYIASKGIRERLSQPALRINGVKIYADGSLGAKTAALREPYSDDPANTGILRHSNEDLATLVEAADSEGYQVIIHAIGDRAIEQSIGALALIAGTKNPRRHRIEHASLLPRDLRDKMAKHAIRATVQPQFITSDTWAVSRLGEERTRDLYPLKSMLSDGLLVSGSSDAPVESMSPVLGAWSAMTRGGQTMDEALSLDQALSLYTRHAASNGLDEIRDDLQIGSAADLTLLDSDVTTMHPALFRKVGVTATIVGGELAYSFPTG